MNLKILPNNQFKRFFIEDKKDLFKFVAKELKELTKKNLQLPVKLYQL